MKKTIIVIRCKLPKPLCSKFFRQLKYICPVPIDSMKTFGIKCMFSWFCILMMPAAASMKEYGIRQNTYVFAHAYMAHKNSYTTKPLL